MHERKWFVEKSVCIETNQNRTNMYLWQIYSIFALNIYLNTSYKTILLPIYQDCLFVVICSVNEQSHCKFWSGKLRFLAETISSEFVSGISFWNQAIVQGAKLSVG